MRYCEQVRPVEWARKLKPQLKKGPYCPTLAELKAATRTPTCPPLRGRGWALKGRNWAVSGPTPDIPTIHFPPKKKRRRNHANSSSFHCRYGTQLDWHFS